uniref:Nuclear RNA export factor Tap RNA-binding domain-containing protein n=1 Tax=Eptatretus burgeri TaxID=7764 RepID=A0A8C4R1V0_EPTBU
MPYKEHDDRVGGPPVNRRRKGRGPFRATLYSEEGSSWDNDSRRAGGGTMGGQRNRRGHGGGGGGGGGRGGGGGGGGGSQKWSRGRRSRGHAARNPRGLEDVDSDVDMREDGVQRQQQRFLPYSRNRRNRNQGKNFEVTVNNDNSTGHVIHGNTMWKDPGWHKITIPHGKKYDRNWLLQSIQGVCAQPFTPVLVTILFFFLSTILPRSIKLKMGAILII